MDGKLEIDALQLPPNTLVVPTAFIEGKQHNSGQPARGKRLVGASSQPKSTTYSAQIEYLDNLAVKYAQLIDTEEQARKEAQAVADAQYTTKASRAREQATSTARLHKGQLAE